MTRKQRQDGRFVTLRSGQVVFIPKGKRSKWADVRERVLASQKEEGQAVEGKKGIMAQITDATGRYGFEWNKRLYRAGEPSERGTFYAIDREVADTYSELLGEPVGEFEFPDVKRALVVDLDEGTLKEVERYAGKKFKDVGDVALLIEDAMAGIKADGYDSIVIVGETGGDIPGTPIEFVDLTGKEARRLRTYKKPAAERRPPAREELTISPMRGVELKVKGARSNARSAAAAAKKGNVKTARLYTKWAQTFHTQLQQEAERVGTPEVREAAREAGVAAREAAEHVREAERGGK